MSLNALPTAALLAIAVALFVQAGMMWDPPPQEIHFRTIMKYCQELPSVRAQGPEAYFKCVAELAPK